MFIPITIDECRKLGWKELDIILVSGDAYIDSSYDGIALLGKYLISLGYRVGIISQPDINNPEEISIFGEPKLFWGVSGGCVDSMVANYTALKKPKRSDDLTPGGRNEKRPDRAVIRYTNLIKQKYKNSKPIVIGGIEASLRRIAHYDYWSDSIRRSILFDSKADYLIYGMAEKTLKEFCDKIVAGDDPRDLRGLCYIAKEARYDYKLIPSFEEVKQDNLKLIEMFHEFYKNNDPLNADGLVQKHGERYLIQNPPNYYLDQKELDAIFKLEFERDVHPLLKKQGEVKALETVKYSINSHRGCYGECNFCSITVHQGRTIRSRSEESILQEARDIASHSGFKGYISDVGGATANMYENSCKKQQKKGSCKDKRCTFPDRCKSMKIDHKPQVQLLDKLRNVKGVKKAFVGSGIRYDLVFEDDKNGGKYIRDVVKHHVSGQMKIAPEHTEDKVLDLMGKPGKHVLKRFKDEFYRITKESGKKQFLTYYLISSHPGCTEKEMKGLNEFVKDELKISPEQVQIFTPTPSTYSSLMYHTGLNPFTMDPIYIEKEHKGKDSQKKMITGDTRKPKKKEYKKPYNSYKKKR
jgi:uncharacterized radical SAM protein YgiQ